MVTAPPIPTRFPCWCRAVYSWGGESKRDLGFVEGDLIECLNAGDGSWWTGRLFRDKRCIGLFPSNFVQVLDESFKPAMRVSGGIPERTPSPNPFSPPATQTNKPKPFRKPFQAYAAPDEAAIKRAETRKQEAQSLRPSQVSARPVREERLAATTVARHQSQASTINAHAYGARPASRAASPAVHCSREPSPIDHPGRLSFESRQDANSTYRDYALDQRPSSRLSYEPPRNGSMMNRGFETNGTAQSAGPAPPRHGHSISRAVSPALSFAPSQRPSEIYQDEYLPEASPPPPIPPPHRTVNSSPRKAPSIHDLAPISIPNTPQHVTAAPTSSAGNGATPSPLRSAMDDVMSSLADMAVSRDHVQDTTDPWSAEAFGQHFSSRSNRHQPLRPNTSMGIASQSGYEADPDELHFGSPLSSSPSKKPTSQLSDYVQRMESRLGNMHKNNHKSRHGEHVEAATRRLAALGRPASALGNTEDPHVRLRHRKSAFDVGRSVLGRTFTNKTTSTNSSAATRSTATNSTTDRSIMSGPSASGFSSTSAGSLARRKVGAHSRARSAMSFRNDDQSQYGNTGNRPQTPLTTFSYHSSHASNPSQARAQSQLGYHGSFGEQDQVHGGLTAPKQKKSGFFKKMIESARTGAASARSSLAAGDLSTSGNSSLSPKKLGNITSRSQQGPRNAASEMGLNPSAGMNWVQVRRDVNRSNSLSNIEMIERAERCQMMDYPAISPVRELYRDCEGDEGANGHVVPDPTDFQTVNLSLVDKNARFINNLPPMTNPISLATGFVCRPYRSDVQRLRAIFIWVSEKILWEEAFESDSDMRRVIQNKRACPEEVATLTQEMCAAVGIHAEVVRGYLKTPGEVPELNIRPRPNHFWNAVVVDGEWRMMDCSLASPSHPRRGQFSSMCGAQAETWWFLARPMDLCWSHVPDNHEQQHLCPAMAIETLLALPCACPPFFKNEIQMPDYNTSHIRIEDLELAHIRFTVPEDIECVAEIEARAYERDADGDVFENGEIIKKHALAQAEWVGGQKRYTVKALLPGDEGHGVLKIYAGQRGLMHSIKDIPHPLAFVLPIVHTGDNPPYDFVTRHPTPHAQRHDLYVAQPQCKTLAVNHTFVFAIRQHPSSLSAETPVDGGTSPIPFMRPASALSFTNSSVTGSDPSTRNNNSSRKPAKLAIQAPSGKVLRLMRKDDRAQTTSQGVETGDGGTWETIIKCGETGVWRGLVLADRSARWAVFAEWTCV